MKKGSTGNDPGSVIWKNVADPSSTRADDDSDGDEPSERSRRKSISSASGVSLLIMSKIGMYIAMTMPPTTTPRKAIMIGSSSVSRPATAVSTSSS